MKKLILSLAVVLISTSARAECEEGHIIGAVTGECVAAKGSCGTNCSYTLDENGKLDVFPTEAGKDAVYSYVSGNANIIQANLGEGITSIGFRAFFNANALENVKLPETLKTLNEQAFGHTNIKTLELPNGLTKLDHFTFYAMNDVDIILSTSITEISSSSVIQNQGKVYAATPEQEKLLKDVQVSANKIFVYQTNADEIIVSQQGRELYKYDNKDNMLAGTDWLERYEYSDDKKYGGLRQEAYAKDGDGEKYIGAKIFRPDGSIVLVDENNKFINKRHAKIYTVEEAMAVTREGNVNRVRLTYK